MYGEFDEQDMHDILDVHLKGSFWVTQAAFRVMKEQRYGRVVFVTSGAGLYGRPNSPGYVAAKAGIVGLMNTLSIEGAEYGVLANAVAPIANTRMTGSMFVDDPVGMRPELVATAVVFLASEQCTLTHEIIQAGHGLYARVFVARTPGWSVDPNSEPTPEDLLEHLDQIRDTDGFLVPVNAHDDLATVLGASAG
jgi:NAD(P)-dependent dehydrogenase (short-subunit alcohol dehydrogenase family)